jgi:hypothetical protein
MSADIIHELGHLVTKHDDDHPAFWAWMKENGQPVPKEHRG